MPLIEAVKELERLFEGLAVKVTAWGEGVAELFDIASQLRAENASLKAANDKLRIEFELRALLEEQGRQIEALKAAR